MTTNSYDFAVYNRDIDKEELSSPPPPRCRTCENEVPFEPEGTTPRQLTETYTGPTDFWWCDHCKESRWEEELHWS